MNGGRIHRLAQPVADAIAAGEVIERPASVVKELIENSLDAGARTVEVIAHGGGLTRIEVVDDGAGIPARDLELALAPHATSKIQRMTDLDSVSTLGFRGEALASIAAIAEVSITSRPPGQQAAATIRGVAGGVSTPESTAAAPGTRVTVCDLFATTPARLRFLKGERAESAAIRRVVAELALGRPDVGFRLTVDGTEALHTPGDGQLAGAARAVLGPRAAADLVPVASPGDPAVTGALSNPAAHAGNRAGLVLFVNRRRVQSGLLAAAVLEAYRGLLPAGRYPYGVVAVDVDPALVDVNVHPAKREVRLRDERAVFTAVERACRGATQVALSVPSRGAHAGLPAPARVEASLAFLAPLGLQLEDAADAPAADLRALAPLTVLGQAYGEWIVAAGRDAVVLIDPHAAHEKMLYEELLERWRRDGGEQAQLLLLPAVLELSPARWERFQRSEELLATCGFLLERFGPAMIRCTAVPAAVAAAEPGRLIEELLDTLDEDGDDGRQRHRVAALAACHAAVRFGDRLDAEEQRRLAERLPLTPGGATCPHGRPTALVLNEASLRRTFRRPTG